MFSAFCCAIGKHVSWAINAAYLHVCDANLVIVKGGPNATLYHCDTWNDWDTNPTAPQNPNGGGPKYYGISHVDFCSRKLTSNCATPQVEPTGGVSLSYR